VLEVGNRTDVLALAPTFGDVDILVNNAGGVRGQVGRPIEEISESDWQTIFDVNLSGAFFMTQAVAPAMKRRKAGRIINISSGAGLGISLTGIQPMPVPRQVRSASLASLPMSSGPGASRSTMWRQASYAPTRRPNASGKRWAKRARRGFCRISR
jgi:NAD(P)-dependent dehydrogenase (short-subunit alcohol dehydrogenase family)